MKKVTVDVDASLCETLEMYDYEYRCRRDILTHLLDNGVSIDSPSFIAYQKEADKSYKSFEITKQIIQSTYVDKIPNAVNWNLTYNTHKLDITVNED